MDTSNEHIVRSIEALDAENQGRYMPVPRRLRAEAVRELAGRDSVYMNPDTAKGLAEWAAKKRDKARAKARKSKVSKRQNRR